MENKNFEEILNSNIEIMKRLISLETSANASNIRISDLTKRVSVLENENDNLKNRTTSLEHKFYSCILKDIIEIISEGIRKLLPFDQRKLKDKKIIEVLKKIPNFNKDYITIFEILGNMKIKQSFYIREFSKFNLEDLFNYIKDNFFKENESEQERLTLEKMIKNIFSFEGGQKSFIDENGSVNLIKYYREFNNEESIQNVINFINN